MNRGVVFDVDDTLYLERDYVRSGFEAVDRHVRHTYGLEGFMDVAWRLFTAGRRGDTFDEAVVRLGAEDELVPVDELVGVYRTHMPSIELLADSEKALERLDARGVPIVVITDGPESSQNAKVEALGLRDRAALIVVTAGLGLGKGKPHEAGFLCVQHELGLTGSELVYVADNPAKDFVAPRRLGWRTFRVRRPGSLHEDVASGADVDREARDLSNVTLL